ncbi:MAG: sulfatase-like hydrolase/transferase [Candidatus Marinimicrobia bacterium]|nr:sulfatase-like hydrolase/transferase [Candidatus Neomarinimicrobiota bacterium]MCF7880140.1 sulfatase-like hydrolase/transferase [Candidatus Neomarinimicrobiota bacterium]
MRILYIDIDTLRPDHLGCYGYHRETSPNIDSVAEQGIRFENCYVSNGPCLPSRTALFSGRDGMRTGVVSHGGTAADMRLDGDSRGFDSVLGRTSWMRQLRNAGLRTVTVSPFGERHSAWHWYANFSEIYNPGKHGEERADEIFPYADDWLKRNGRDDDWFLHVNFWDPHTPYRTPESFGNPFENEPIPEWYTEEVRRRNWNGSGPWSAQEGMGYGGPHPYVGPQYPRQPNTMHSMEEVRRMFDGYDCGILYMDDYLGLLFDRLKELGIYEETAIIISADHGENLGELNVHFDHQTADQHTSRVPLIIKWSYLSDTLDNTCDHLIYQYDMAATIIELLGEKVPDNWDGKSFATEIKSGKSFGRDYLVLTQAAHTCQRSVRFGPYLFIRSYFDAYHDYPESMLFNLEHDPHEQNNIFDESPEIQATALNYLDQWRAEMERKSDYKRDPLWTVMEEGLPLHTRTNLNDYLERLRNTNREEVAERIANRYPHHLV